MTSPSEGVAICAASDCGLPIMTWREVYRCTECDFPFHRKCLGPKHSNTWKPPHPRVEELTAALRGLISAVDGVEWDALADRATGRLDDARSRAREVLRPADETKEGL